MVCVNFRRLMVVGTLGIGMAVLPAMTQGQIINSWEGNLEDWTAESGFSIANTAGGANAGIGVTNGSDSLEITIPAPGYQRWGRRVLSGQALTDLAAAAEHPLTRRIEFDMTYDFSQMPAPTPATYTWQQMAWQTNAGWSQIDFFVEGYTGNTNTTVKHAGLLKNFATIRPGVSSAEVIMASESSWGAGSGKVFMDNLRIRQIIPDLDLDTDLDAADWGLFLSHHQTGGFTGGVDARFLLGDFDADRDNDFTDFLVFEAAYDEINGAGAFTDMLAGVPEPTSIALVALGGCGLMVLRRRRRQFAAVLAMMLVIGLHGGASAQLLNSWEGDVEGWIPAGFGAVPSSIAVSTSGATDGTTSLAITQSEGDLFNWNAQGSFGSGSPQYNAFAAAIDIGIENFALEFDLTFDTTVIPQTFVNFIGTSVAFNSSGGWLQYDNLGETTGQVDETVHVSIPLDRVANPPNGTGVLVPASQTGFYQINVAMNGDWGPTPATFYMDNLRLVQTSTPGVLTLEVNRSNGAVRILNQQSGSFDINYYTIGSSNNALDRAGWNSLDAQNIDAVDGPDPGTAAGNSLLEGWDEASSSNNGRLTEAFLNGQTNLGPGEPLSLGFAYDENSYAEGLTFQYQDLSRPGGLTTGNVMYIGTPPTPDGDFNNDGLYNCGDVNALTATIAAATNAPAFDLTGDGQVNVADLDLWRAHAGNVNLPNHHAYLVGDANLDGNVDGSDFGIWNSNKFTANTDWCNGNFNADTVIDGSDFGLWNSNKFQSADSSQVPEPAGMLTALLAFGLLGAGCRRGA